MCSVFLFFIVIKSFKFDFCIFLLYNNFVANFKKNIFFGVIIMNEHRSTVYGLSAEVKRVIWTLNEPLQLKALTKTIQETEAMLREAGTMPLEEVIINVERMAKLNTEAIFEETNNFAKEKIEKIETAKIREIETKKINHIKKIINSTIPEPKPDEMSIGSSEKIKGYKIMHTIINSKKEVDKLKTEIAKITTEIKEQIALEMEAIISTEVIMDASKLFEKTYSEKESTHNQNSETHEEPAPQLQNFEQQNEL